MQQFVTATEAAIHRSHDNDGTAAAPATGTGGDAAVSSTSTDAVMKEWGMARDPSTGGVYYFNKATGVVQWDPPAGWKQAQQQQQQPAYPVAAGYGGYGGYGQGGRGGYGRWPGGRYGQQQAYQQPVCHEFVVLLRLILDVIRIS